MRPNLTESNGQYTENLELVRGDLYADRRGRSARIFTTGELRLDADMADLFTAVKGMNGKAPSRGFARVLYGESVPWRGLARYFAKAGKSGAPLHQLLAILQRLDRFACEVCDKTDSQDRAA